MSEFTADRDPFERLAEEFAERLRRGEHPAITEYTARYPEHADDIRELFPEIALVEQYKPAQPDRGMSSPAAMPARPGGLSDQLGDYRILRTLGEGGMGVVYEAVRESLRSNVALKVMHPQFRAREKYLRRFRTEARSAARLHHTNIVSVFDYGVHDGVCFYAMQYIAGHSVDKVLADVRRLRQEKEAPPAVETATMPSGQEGPSRLDRRSVQPRHGDATMDASRRAVSIGLLTGQWSLAPMSQSSHDDAIPSALAASVAIEDMDPIDGRTEALGPGAGKAGENGDEPAGAVAGVRRTALRRLALELAQTDGEIAPAIEPRARPVDAPGHEPPATGDSGAAAPGPSAFPGSASSIIGKSEARYYREVGRLGAQVADALAYAHKRGVLHRDIKPPNLILDALGNIWITDFGLAKFEDGDDLSQSHDLVGTLRYMAPERFRGVSDPRCDLYALGATLYEMLTLRPAFRGDDQLQLIRRIENEPPVPPRQLERGIPADLETIVLKALAKNPDDRFGTAEEMAAELRRYVENRPIHSRPIPAYQRFGRWCWRNPWLAAANITAAVLTTILAIVSTAAAWSLARAEQRTRLQLFEALHDQARAGRFSRQPGQRFNSLEAIEKAVVIGRELKLPPEKFERLRDEAIACLALPDLKPTGRVMTLPPGVIGTAFDRTMTRYARRFRDGTVSVHRAADDQEIARFQAVGDRDFFIFQFSLDGRYLATEDYPSRALKVWDIDRRRLTVNDPRPIWKQVSFRANGRRILAAQGKLHEYDLPSGQLIRTWPGRVDRAVFRPDGAQIAVIDGVSTPQICRIHNAESGQLLQDFPLRSPVDYVAWSPDGTTLATAGMDGKLDVWDAVTGVRRATLEGHDDGGLRSSFHPAGTLLASNGFEGRLRLWDPIQGRPLLSLSGGSIGEFNPDGRIVLQVADQLTTYQVEPALEYRTLAHASRELMDCHRPSIRHDGRILAVGSNRGAVLWDLARGTELAFLPIGLAWGVMFEPSGDLITDGNMGVQRWPVELDTARSEFRIGPPRRLNLPVNSGSVTEDRSGRIMAVAARRYAYVATPERTIRVGPLDDCRYVAVSPDGQWLATGTHVASHGAQVWRIRDGTKMVELPIDGGTVVAFSPDGKWLVAGSPRLRLWEVGTWREETRITDVGRYFSPDGRLTVVIEPSRILRLVEVETGRTLARLESPDLSSVYDVAFSPDGARLVVTTKDRPTPCVHAWDLRAIRKHLSRLRLDWDAPAYPEDDPADPKAPTPPALQVDFGPLTEHLQHFNEDDEVLVQRHTARLKSDPNNADAYHHRAHARASLRRFPEAIADLDEAIRRRPDDAHLRDVRGRIHAFLKQYEPAIADLEAALAMKSDHPQLKQNLASCCNNRAWELANGPEPRRDLKRALTLAQRAVELAPDEGIFLNTLGVALYRAGRYAESIATLERSLAAGRGQSDAFDLFFLAMAHHRLGHQDQARDCYDRAVRWIQEQKNLTPQYTQELTSFRAEAESVLAGHEGKLPDDVFAAPR